MIRRTLATVCLAGQVVAGPLVSTPYEGSYEDAVFAVEQAITGAGLVVDHVSHVGEMLDRTAADVGGGETIFDAAQVFLFCSAVVSRQVMEIEPENIAFCPYGIVVMAQGGEVSIGRQDYPEGAMDAVERLIDGIIDEAAAF